MILTMKRIALSALLAALAATGARAQDYEGGPDSDIRQTVARVGYFSGDVSFARGDDPDDWQPADANTPLTLGDRVWTAGGRLELQVHGGAIVRLASGTDLTALNLTEDTKQFSVSAGVASFRLPRLRDDEVFEVDTPNAAVTFERAGDYRIDVRQNGDTRVQVRRGRAIVASGGGQVPLGAGDGILIEGSDPPSYDMTGVAPLDGWDGWVADRDARYANVASYQYVSPDIAGVEDLDQYGRWRQVPSYGWCWTPASVTVGWAPYRVGRWMWQDPWGWTWVSSEPWGWAPYHYGRWVTWNSSWYWVPVAPRVAVATYSPALVAFVGGGPGFGVSVGVSTDYVGWFPLAPRDPLIPWWGRPVTNVQVTNVTYVNRTYVTVVNQTTFVSSRVVTNNTVRDQAVVSRLERAPVVRGAVPIVPTRESIRTATRAASAPRPPAMVAARSVVTRMAPPPAPPRFDAKVAVIRENKGAPVSTREAQRIVTRESREAPKPSAAVRPVAAEAGRVTLAPKTANAQAPRPEPVSPSRGRPLATKEQPVAPARETGAPAAQRPADTPAERDARREQAQKEQAERQEAQREQAQRQQQEQAGEAQKIQREQAQKEQADRQQAQREQAQRQQEQRRQAQQEQTQKEQVQKEQLQKQQTQREQAQRQQSQKEQAQRQQEQRDQAEKERSARVPPSKPTPRSEAQPERAQARPPAREAEQPAERVQPERQQKPPEKPAQAASAPTPQRGRGAKPQPTKTPKKEDKKKDEDR